VRLRGVLFAAMLLVPSVARAADDEPICADRPGVATPTCTVPPGMVQVETGIFDWARDRTAGVRIDDLSIGETALKLGLTNRFHLEIDLAPYVRSKVRAGGPSETVSGFGDMALAAKYRFTKDSAPVQVAVRPFVKIPTAKSSLGNGKVEGGLIVPIEYSIPGSQLTLAFSPELDVNADGDGSGHHLAMAQVIGLGIPLDSRLSASAELWGYWDFDPQRTARQYAAAGSFAYLVSNDVQIDAGANFGLNRNTPDVEIYSGIAVRF
jgi:hypothetical protein